MKPEVKKGIIGVSVGKGKDGGVQSRIWLPVIFLIIGLVCLGCATISTYSETAYQQATSLKVDSLALMGKATGPYAQHQAEVEALRLKLDKAYEYAKGLPKNEITARQWEILKDPNGQLLGGFLARWQQKSTLSPDFIAEAQIDVRNAFDQIIKLESGKIKPSELK